MATQPAPHRTRRHWSVASSSNPAAQYLIARGSRTGNRRWAESSHVFYVDVNVVASTEPEDQKTLAENIRFCGESWWACRARLRPVETSPMALLNWCREHHVSQSHFRPLHLPRTGWQRYLSILCRPSSVSPATRLPSTFHIVTRRTLQVRDPPSILVVDDDPQITRSAAHKSLGTRV